MNFLHVVGWVFYVVALLVASGLLAIELNAWWSLRADPEKRARAKGRITRRVSGALMLLGILIILLYIVLETVGPLGKLFFMLLVILLLVGVCLIAAFDFVMTRLEMKSEIDGFLQSSATDFTEDLRELAEKNPKLKQELPQFFPKEQKKKSRKKK